MGYIYCITNLVNQKKYVGKTIYSITERFKEHCSDSKLNGTVHSSQILKFF